MVSRHPIQLKPFYDPMEYLQLPIPLNLVITQKGGIVQ